MDFTSFIQNIINSIDIQKFIRSYGTHLCQSGHKITFAHNDVEIIVVAGGTGIVQLGGKKLTILNNNCLIVSGQTFELSVNSPGNCTFLNLRLDLTAAGLSSEKSNLYTLFSTEGFKMLLPPDSGNYSVIRLNDCMEIQLVVKRILYELTLEAPYRNTLLKLLLGELLILLSRSVEKRNSETVNTTNCYIANAIDYIDSNISHELSTQSIAKAIHLSPDYMNHIFKAGTGYSLMEYVNVKRVERCKLLLRQTSLNISDISLEVGISSPQYLSTLFRKFTSLSPISYRKGFCTEVCFHSDFPLKVNCGGPQTDGLASDRPYKKGEWGYIGNTMTYSTEDFIESNHGYTTGLKSLRYGGIFSYRFNVSNRVYDITLLFAEIYFTAINERTFQIKINGRIVQECFDIFYAAKGHHTGITMVFKDISVCDGFLEIEFISIHNYAQINVIEVIPKS